MPGRRAPRDLVVEIGGDVVLQKFPEVLDDELGCTGILVLLEPLVDPDDIHEFVSQVILRALSVLEDDRGAHGDRRDRKNGEDRPLRPRDIRVDPENPQVLVRDLLKARPDIGRGQLVLDLPAIFIKIDLGEGGGFLEVDLELLLPTVGADSLLLDVFFGDDIAAEIVLRTDDFLDLFSRHQQPGA